MTFYAMSQKNRPRLIRYQHRSVTVILTHIIRKAEAQLRVCCYCICDMWTVGDVMINQGTRWRWGEAGVELPCSFDSPSSSPNFQPLPQRSMTLTLLLAFMFMLLKNASKMPFWTSVLVWRGYSPLHTWTPSLVASCHAPLLCVLATYTHSLLL